MENNQHELLPSDVQGKGFLRLYAKYLDLQVDPLLNSWESNQISESVENPAETSQDMQTGVSDQHGDDNDNQEISSADPDPVIWISGDEPVPAGLGESQQIFKEIGNELRSQREKLSISLFDVEKYTRLKQAQISALESGRIDQLPSTVQAKGMLNNYANFLQADSEKLLLRFADGLQTQLAEKKVVSSEKSSSRSSPIKQPSGWRKLFTLDLVIGSSMILFLLIFSIWGLIQISSSGNDAMDIEAPGIVEMLQVTPSLSQEDSLSTNPLSSQEAELEQAANEEEQQVLNDTGEVTETIPAEDNSPIQLYIVALQRAYLKVAVDGETEFDGRIVPGNAYQFSGNELIEITSGNAAALQVFYNQQNMGSLGFVGEVVKFQFAITGVITPTPMFTATSTSTPVSTVTLQPTPTVLTPTPTMTPITP